MLSDTSVSGSVQRCLTGNISTVNTHVKSCSKLLPWFTSLVCQQQQQSVALYRHSGTIFHDIPMPENTKFHGFPGLGCICKGFSTFGWCYQWCGLRLLVLGQEWYRTKKSVLVLHAVVLVVQVWCTSSTLDIIMILNDTATFQLSRTIYSFYISPDVPAHNILQHCVNFSQGRCPVPDWKRPPGRPRKTWIQQVEEDHGRTIDSLWSSLVVEVSIQMHLQDFTVFQVRFRSVFTESRGFIFFPVSVFTRIMGKANH